MTFSEKRKTYKTPKLLTGGVKEAFCANQGSPQTATVFHQLTPGPAWRPFSYNLPPPYNSRTNRAIIKNF